MSNFKDIKWQFNYDRRMTYQKIRIFNHGLAYRIPEFFNVELGSEVDRVKECNVSVYYDADQFTKAFSLIGKILTDKGSEGLFRKMSLIIVEDYKVYKSQTDSFTTDYSRHSNAELTDVYNAFCELDQKISLTTWFLFMTFEEIFTKILRERLVEKVENEPEIKNIISTLSLPAMITPSDQYQIDACVAALSADKETASADLAKKYVSWGMYDVNYPESKPVGHKEKIDQINTSDAQKLIDDIETRYARQSSDVQEIKAIYKDDEDLSSLIELFCTYASYKEWKNYFREENSYKLKSLLSEIAQRIGLTLVQIAFMTEIEIKDILNGKQAVAVSELDRRMNNSAFVSVDGKLNIITDLEELQQIDERLLAKQVSEIKGTGAYPGVVRGTVRIILSNNDFHLLKEGDVLVTSTTRPDYLPIMEKASAFVTNEGGLLSHAAIIAREMKKTCVIGTKIATKVLKDGDMVEVDAERGIVKIIEKL